MESNSYLVKAANVAKRPVMRRAACEVIPEEANSLDSDDDLIEDAGPLPMPPHVNVGIPVPEPQSKQASSHWVRTLAQALLQYLPARGS